MEYRILGSLEVVDADGRPIVLVGRVRVLLALLLLHANETISVERLIDELWGERPPATARKVVQNLVSQLRKPLGARLETRGHGYRLRVEPGELDLGRFEQLLQEAERLRAAGEPAASAARLRDALALWRGPALADLGYEQLAAGAAAHLDEQRLAALEAHFDAELTLGSDRSLVSELEQLVDEQPLRERLRGQLMLALYRAGRQADALATYREGRALLVERLGLEPGAELQRLEQAILRHDTALAPQLPPPSAGPVAAAEAAARGRAFRSVLCRPWTVATAGLLLVVATAAVALLELGRSGPPPATAAPNSLAIVDPTDGRLLTTVAVGTRPAAVAVGAGAVWVANADDGTVSRIDPKTRKVVQTIGVGGPLADIVADGRSVWVVTGSEGKLVEIDPRTNAVVRRLDLSGADKLLPAGAYTLAVGGGAVWIGSDIAGGCLLRFDPESGQVSMVARKGWTPAGIAASDDAVWATFPVGGTVRVEPKVNQITAAIDEPPNGISLALGAGSVWVGELRGWSGGPSAVWQLAPATATPIRAIPVAGNPIGIAVADGRVWVADGFGGTLTEIDARRATIVRARTLGPALTDVIYGAGALWVTVTDRGPPSEVPAERRSGP